MEEILIPLSAVLSMTSGLCLDCQEKVRQTIARTQRNGRQSALQRLGAIMVAAQAEFGVPESEIVHGGNHRHLVEVRRTIAIRARQAGFSYPQIGGLLHRHHTSIMHLIGSRDTNIKRKSLTESKTVR